jgi:hypothetical protein
VCGPGATGRGICFDDCASDADCTRAGYACRDVDYDGPSTDMACMPACTDDSECANRERFGFECNQGTGLCGAPFAGTVGAECIDEEGCVGGRCLVEADGWMGGYCVALGCAMSGKGGEACPVGTTCTDDETGNPDIGYCLQSCTAGASTGCREGYECAVEGRETEGVCRPVEATPPPPR